jgi:hypothetical protein
MLSHQINRMTLVFILAALCVAHQGRCQNSPSPQAPNMAKDSVAGSVLFFDDFDDNRNNWTIGGDKHETAKMEGGVYYITAEGRAYGQGLELKINTHKDFAIEARIKMVSGSAEHKNYYSMLFWGREADASYVFTFAKDGFISVEACSGINQKDCVTNSGSFQKTLLDPDGFNVYLVRKVGKKYTFFVNGTEVYEMPFAPFFGNWLGVGAGRKSTLAVDYLKVSYL